MMDDDLELLTQPIDDPVDDEPTANTKEEHSIKNCALLSSTPLVDGINSFGQAHADGKYRKRVSREHFRLELNLAGESCAITSCVQDSCHTKNGLKRSVWVNGVKLAGKRRLFGGEKIEMLQRNGESIIGCSLIFRCALNRKLQYTVNTRIISAPRFDESDKSSSLIHMLLEHGAVSLKTPPELPKFDADEHRTWNEATEALHKIVEAHGDEWLQKDSKHKLARLRDIVQFRTSTINGENLGNTVSGAGHQKSSDNSTKIDWKFRKVDEGLLAQFGWLAKWRHYFTKAKSAYCKLILKQLRKFNEEISPRAHRSNPILQSECNKSVLRHVAYPSGGNVTEHTDYGIVTIQESTSSGFQGLFDGHCRPVGPPQWRDYATAGDQEEKCPADCAPGCACSVCVDWRNALDKFHGEQKTEIQWYNVQLHEDGAEGYCLVYGGDMLRKLTSGRRETDAAIPIFHRVVVNENTAGDAKGIDADTAVAKAVRHARIFFLQPSEGDTCDPLDSSAYVDHHTRKTKLACVGAQAAEQAVEQAVAPAPERDEDRREGELSVEGEEVGKVGNGEAVAEEVSSPPAPAPKRPRLSNGLIDEHFKKMKPRERPYGNGK
jgi:hypothetical protein